MVARPYAGSFLVRPMHCCRGMQHTGLPHEKHIHLPNAGTLKQLMEHRGECSVSIYFPTLQAGPETQQNRIHFKNALKQAEDGLRACGSSDEAIERTLAPIRGWADDEERWAHQGHGKAIFLHDGECHAHRLPASVEARTLVGDRFHVLPLIELQSASLDHYVLCLEQNGPRLLHSSAFAMDEVVMDFPSLSDVLGEELTNETQQGHSTNGAGGRHIFHGHGDGSDEEHKKELRKYCRAIDDAVRGILPSERTPLVVVAVDYVGAIYAEASHHGNLVGRVTGNPGSFDREELHRRALEVAEEQLRSPEHQDLERYEAARRTSKTTSDIRELLTAATDGRVELLLVADDQLRFGSWDPEKRKLSAAPETPRSENELLDLVAREVLAKGGRVRFMGDEDLELHADEPAVAVLRF